VASIENRVDPVVHVVRGNRAERFILPVRSASLRRPVSTMVAPAAARASAAASPIPLPAPVTQATWPLKLIMFGSLTEWRIRARP
jgi:hypothetical protein